MLVIGGCFRNAEPELGGDIAKLGLGTSNNRSGYGLRLTRPTKLEERCEQRRGRIAYAHLSNIRDCRLMIAIKQLIGRMQYAPTGHHHNKNIKAKKNRIRALMRLKRERHCIHCPAV